MTDFICPNCRGGFPEPKNFGECPWCGQELDGNYEYEPQVRSITTSSDTEPTFLGKLGLRKQ